MAKFDAVFARFHLLSFEAAVFDLAADLRAAHNLKTPDALHAAVAIHHGCAEFWTNDNRLERLSDRIQVRILPGGSQVAT